MVNKIGWCDKTVNPVVGCNIRCGDWCYARRQAKRQKQNCMKCYKFIPHEHLDRLKQLTPRQKPMKVFIDSMWDWNSPGVKPEWCREIIAKMKECSQHIFLILSKELEGYKSYEFPKNVWLGTSVTTDEDTERIYELMYLQHKGNNVFLSIEPLLKRVNPFSIRRVDWVIIGALSRQGKEPLQPEKEWVTDIIKKIDDFEKIPVFTKDNLTIVEPRKEFPKAMEHTIRQVA